MAAKDIYATHAEAKTAVQALGIKSMLQYNKLYKEDPRLPSNPSRAYRDLGWVNNYNFFGKKPTDIYATLAEAIAAVQALGIKSMVQYEERYKEDPKLPGNPLWAYRDLGWVNNYDFFGTEEPTDKYTTYAEAKTAVQALGVKSMVQYKKRCKEDPRLQSNPQWAYRDLGWVNNYDFFGTEKPTDKYTTYAEAQTALQALGVKIMTQYRKLYKEDPKLYRFPKKAYDGAGWIDWFEYLGNQYPISEFKTRILSEGITTQEQYDELTKKSKALPKDPLAFYGFKSFADIINI
jgi:hypothetical protein